MRKILVMILLVSVVLVSVFAEQVGSGSLNVFGKVGAGGISFTVNQTSSDRIDLLNNADVQPDGDGVILGNWVFAASNQASPQNYTVEYEANALVLAGATSIEYDVVIYDDGVGGVESETTFTATAGSVNVTRGVGVRLKSAIPAEQTASENYNGTIIIKLMTE